MIGGRRYHLKRLKGVKKKRITVKRHVRKDLGQFNTGGGEKMRIGDHHRGVASFLGVQAPCFKNQKGKGPLRQKAGPRKSWKRKNWATIKFVKTNSRRKNGIVDGKEKESGRGAREGGGVAGTNEKGDVDYLSERESEKGVFGGNTGGGHAHHG